MGSLANERARIISNACVGPNLYCMTLVSPVIAQVIEPGQFVHMKIPRMEAHILRRPFSVYARDVAQGTLEILYQVVGFGSDHMTSLVPDEEVELIGAIGNTWQVPTTAKRALLVAGGVGAAPLFLLAEQLHLKGVHTDVVLGAQTEQALVCRFRYETLLSVPPRCSTDDGTFGREGFCTSLVAEALTEAADTGEPYDYLAVCGPEPLMKIVAGMAAESNVFCQLSMERRMACGVGACLSCVVD
ncbi:MAG: dihydroorotate dehydrogenase electron transfer subunit, partial [Raoultibacter sp.]